MGRKAYEKVECRKGGETWRPWLALLFNLMDLTAKRTEVQVLAKGDVFDGRRDDSLIDGIHQ